MVQWLVVEFRVLGPLEVVVDGSVVAVRSGKQKAVLAILLLAAGRTVTADQLIETAWGDELPADPPNTLQQAVAQLRKRLEPDRRPSDAPAILRTEAGGYSLDVDGHKLDATIFDELVSRGRRDISADEPLQALDALRRALQLWRGPAYVDFVYEDFVGGEVERLTELRLEAEELLTDAVLAVEGPEAAVADLDRLVAAEPLRERRWERLMAALYRSGRQADALRAYQDAQRLFADELGLDLSPALQQLEQQILLNDPVLGISGRPDSPAPTNLPVETTGFFGRQDLLSEIGESLSSRRLVTLTGPGGSGKTRLARRAAGEALHRFPGGVFLVRLDSIDDPSLAVGIVAASVGLIEDPTKTMIEALGDHLSASQALLVLDNCEHLIESIADIVGSLLARCPNLIVLATSQEPLRTSGEHVLRVPPLDVPGVSGAPFEQLDELPAVELFLDRASLPGAPSDVDLAAIASIVRVFDGLPLAIELAAASTRAFSPVEVAARLAESFSLLDSADREAPTRQQTLDGALDWSYRLLSKPQQVLLDRLSVFVGRFDLEAVRAVAADEQDDTWTMVGALVEKSLVERSHVVGTEGRFRLLATVRRYGERRLAASGLTEVIRNRHLDYYVDLCESQAEKIRGRTQLAAMDRLASEESNMRAALAWSLASNKVSKGMRIGAAAGIYWDWRGSISEAARWLDRLLGATGDEAVRGEASAAGWAGYFAFELGDEERARALSDSAVEIARAAYHDELPMTLSGPALYARSSGDLGEASRLNQEMRELGTALDNAWTVAWADNHDALTNLAAGNFDEADRYAELSLEEFRSLGDRRGRGWALTVLAQICHARRRWEHAGRLAEEAGKVARSVGDGRTVSWALEIAADAADQLGDSDHTAELAAAASAARQERGTPFSAWRRQ